MEPSREVSTNSYPLRQDTEGNDEVDDVFHANLMEKVASSETSTCRSWPNDCMYFIPNLMNGAAAVRILLDDTIYRPSSRGLYHVVDIPRTSSPTCEISPDNFKQWLSRELSPGALSILFIPQKRFYLDHETKNQIQLQMNAWQTVLIDGEIPPNAIELLYDNNGGCWEHISFCDDSGCDSPLEHCAYHVCMKLGGDYEHFLYARYDHHTKTSFVLVMGTSEDVQLRWLNDQFRDSEGTNLFCVLLCLASAWAREIDNSRWTLDFNVQELEKIGHVTPQFLGVEPLPLERLSLRMEMAVTSDSLKKIRYASQGMEEVFGYMSDALMKFHSLVPGGRNCWQLLSAINQRRSQQRTQTAKIWQLKERVDAQWSVIASLLSSHDNKLNMDTVRDTKMQMRRFTTLTAIFLPATFIAAFFSMAFFESDNGFQLNGSIWIYFAITTVLTGLTLLYFEITDVNAEAWSSWLRGVVRKNPSQVREVKSRPMYASPTASGKFESDFEG